MKNQDLRLADRGRLREAFAQRFDSSRLDALNSWNYDKLCAKAALLGAGGHFTAWRLRDPASDLRTRQGDLELVYKRSLPDFAGGEEAGRRRWLAGVEGIKGVDLVPPLAAAFTSDGDLGLLMPFGGEPLAQAAAHWQPLAACIAEVRLQLQAQGYRWPDLAQGRCWQGIPFIYDWSDLALGGRG